MQPIISKINNALSAFSGWLMMVMVSLLVVDIIWRTFAKPLMGMAEFAVFVMMMVVYLGLSRCEEHGEHVRLEFLIDIAQGRLRRAMILSTRLLAVVTVALLYYAVTSDALTAFRTNDSIEGMVSLPIWPTKFVMVVGMTVFMLQAIVNVFKDPDVLNTSPNSDI